METRQKGPSRGSRGAFTLLELLIVIAVIAILSSLLITVIPSAYRKARIAQAHADIEALRGALAMYQSETGMYPRRPGPMGTGNQLFRNDIAYAYAALMNRRTVQLGGGPSSGMSWLAERVGHANASDIDNTAFMSVNPYDTITGAPWLTALSGPERDLVNDGTFQAANLPGSATELVFLDPWGNPYIYREWASVPMSLKGSLAIPRTFQRTTPGTVESTVDRPRDLAGFDLFCAGPDGVLDYGADESDDVCSWKAK
jgi:prepilin-type N-terminal cleavage/methylation domain-containing protein